MDDLRTKFNGMKRIRDRYSVRRAAIVRKNVAVKKIIEANDFIDQEEADLFLDLDCRVEMMLDELDEHCAHLDAELEKIKHGLSAYEELTDPAGREALLRYMDEDMSLSLASLSHGIESYDQVLKSMSELNEML